MYEEIQSNPWDNRQERCRPQHTHTHTRRLGLSPGFSSFWPPTSHQACASQRMHHHTHRHNLPRIFTLLSFVLRYQYQHRPAAGRLQQVTYATSSIPATCSCIPTSQVFTRQYLNEVEQVFAENHTGDAVDLSAVHRDAAVLGLLQQSKETRRNESASVFVS